MKITSRVTEKKCQLVVFGSTLTHNQNIVARLEQKSQYLFIHMYCMCICMHLFYIHLLLHVDSFT